MTTRTLSVAVRTAILDPVIERVHELLRDAGHANKFSAMPVKPFVGNPREAIGFSSSITTFQPGQKAPGLMVVELYCNDKKQWWLSAVLRSGPFREVKHSVQLTQEKLRDPFDSIEKVAITIASCLIVAIPRAPEVKPHPAIKVVPVTA